MIPAWSEEFITFPLLPIPSRSWLLGLSPRSCTCFPTFIGCKDRKCLASLAISRLVEYLPVTEPRV